MKIEVINKIKRTEKRYLFIRETRPLVVEIVQGIVALNTNEIVK